MASNGNWRDILKAQNEDIVKLEFMDADINRQQQRSPSPGGGVRRQSFVGAVDVNVDALRNSPRMKPPGKNSTPDDSPSGPVLRKQFFAPPAHDDSYSFSNIYAKDGNEHQRTDTVPDTPKSPSQTQAAKAPETADRCCPCRRLP